MAARRASSTPIPRAPQPRTSGSTTSVTTCPPRQNERGAPACDEEVMSSLINSGRPDAAAQDQDKGARVYNLDDYIPVAAKNERGAAAEKGNTNSLELQRALGFAAGRAKMLSYPTQTTAAAVEPAADYYDSSDSEALPLVPQVFVDKIMTSGAAVAGGQDNISVAGMFIEPLRRGIAVLGISVASLAVAGMFTERLRRGIAVLSISIASLAVAELAAGEPTPAAAFGLLLIVGLSAVIIHEIGA
ncbi:unnamed protein product [Urochloa decumbens]|uniref:Uncharacterized protein n=1 Tax=Urochloa decumbens TaxID=240449 RepID=A0ABC9BY53_9POAL